MYTLRQLAELVGCELHGDPETKINGAAILSVAKPGEICFARDAKHVKQLADSNASAAIVPTGFSCDIPCILADEPERTFSEIVKTFRPPRKTGFQGISPAAHIDSSAVIGEDVTIYPGAVIGAEVQIGKGSTIYANANLMDGCQVGAEVQIFPLAVLYPDTIVGDRVIVHASAVLGAYGFGYETKEGVHHLSPQLGRVVIGNDCEIGAGTTIDRGTYSDTVVGQGTKIDNQVMIGHNCRIGKHNLLVSQVGIAGSCTTGDYVVMAGQVGIGDHLHIGDRAILTAKAGVMHNIPSGETYVGIPAAPARNQLQVFAIQAKLPEMRKDIKKIKRQLQELSSADKQNEKAA